MTGSAKTLVTVAATGNSMIDGVLYGYAWSGPITYSFPTLAANYAYSEESSQDFAAVTLQQKNAALFSIEQSAGTAANDGFSVEGFTNAVFALGSTTTSTLRFAQSDAPSTAYAYMPGNAAQAGDMWFGRNFDYTNAQAGNYAWHTVLHEIGHALGLKHGHEASGSFAALPADYDSLEYSVMTYRSYQGADTSGYTYGLWSAPQTYMMADIAALQKMYGADFTTNSGNTVYRWSPTDGDTYVNGKIGIDAGGSVIFATVWDGGGIDTYDLRLYTTGLTIDLAPGGHSSFGTSQLAELGDGHFASGNIYNALQYGTDVRSLIENALGGSGNDVISGNAANNSIAGYDGDDTLSGFDGNDVISGGNGNDTLQLGEGTNKADGGAGNDLITAGSGNDAIVGGLGDDTIQAGDGANAVSGVDGNDTITGGSGIDRIAGGNGDDTISGLDGNDIISGDAGNDSIQGGGGNDSINGVTGNDFIFGNDGNDVINGSTGLDRINGGTGNDTMAGGTDADIFVFTLGDGLDRITDFQNNIDKIELDGFSFTSAADVIAHAAQVGRDTVITLSPDQTITLANFALANLDATDFIFPV